MSAELTKIIAGEHDALRRAGRTHGHATDVLAQLHGVSRVAVLLAVGRAAR